MSGSGYGIGAPAGTVALKRYAAPASSSPSEAPGAPIRASVPSLATDSPRLPPPPSGCENVANSTPDGLVGLYRYAAPAPLLSFGEPIRTSLPTAATDVPKPPGSVGSGSEIEATSVVPSYT